MEPSFLPLGIDHFINVESIVYVRETWKYNVRVLDVLTTAGSIELLEECHREKLLRYCEENKLMWVKGKDQMISDVILPPEEPPKPLFTPPSPTPKSVGQVKADMLNSLSELTKLGVVNADSYMKLREAIHEVQDIKVAPPKEEVKEETPV